MTRQERVATDTQRSPGCRTTPLEHWSKRKPTVEPWWAKQQTKKLRPKPTKINSFMSGPSSSLTPDPPACNLESTGESNLESTGVQISIFIYKCNKRCKSATDSCLESNHYCWIIQLLEVEPDSWLGWFP